MPLAGERVQLINTSDQPAPLEQQTVPPGAAIEVVLAVDFEPNARSSRLARGPWGNAGWTTEELMRVARTVRYQGQMHTPKRPPRDGWIDYQSVPDGREHTVVGTLKIQRDVWSAQLGNQRDLLVYLPPSYAHSAQRYPVIYMHDGQNLFDDMTSFAGEWNVDETMEAASRRGLEAIVVGIPNLGEQRLDEYSPFVQPGLGGGRGDAYLAFIVETIKPLIDRDFRTLPDRAHTGVLGSSMGGLISLYAFFRHSAVFGFAGVMSPSLWFADRAILPFVARAPSMPGKLYLDIGTAEGSSTLPMTRHLHHLLYKKGYRAPNLLYVEDRGAGHSESAWARRLPAALEFLLRPQPVATRARVRAAAPVLVSDVRARDAAGGT